MPLFPRSLVQVLRSVLRQLEETPELDSSDPRLAEIKSSILDSIDELEYRRPHAA